MPDPWETLSSRTIFANRWNTLRQDTVKLPDGTVLDDYIVTVRSDVVVVFATTEDGLVPLVRQYKHPVGEVTVELPAGTTDGGDPLDAARRELAEETGYACRELRLIGTVLDDATRNTNRVHIVRGSGARQVGQPVPDQTEKAAGIEVELLTFDAVLDKVRRGEIRAQSSVVAIYRALDDSRRA